MLVADESEWPRRYYSPRTQASLSVVERSRLMTFARRFRLLHEDGRQYWQDVYISQRRVEFARWLIEHGKLSEGIEDGGAA